MKNRHKTDVKNNKKHNIGFSLIELIVVITIMAVLVGLLVPAFTGFVRKNRKKACWSNRESVINVFVRCVYNDSLDAVTTDFSKLLNDPDSCATDTFSRESAAQIKKYNDNVNSHKASYTASVDLATGHTICKIKCDNCEDTVELDLAEWSVAEADEEGDKVGPEQTWPEKEPSDPTESSEEEETTEPDDPPISDSGYWPYQDSDRWTKVGAVAGQKIVLEVPSGIQTSRSGARYVIIGSKDGGTYNLEYEKAISPEYLFTIDAQHVVIISGKFLSESDAYYLNNNNNELYFSGISYGDVVTVEDKSGKKYKYVCWMASPGPGESKIPRDSVGAWTVSGWTRVDR